MTSPQNQPQNPSKSWSIPPPLKRLFDAFPLLTYPENELPARSVRGPRRGARSDLLAFFDAHVGDERGGIGRGKGGNELHALFCWAGSGTEGGGGGGGGGGVGEGEGPGVASFNPGCLRWQAYLVFRGIKFHVVPANNHASFPETLPLLASHPDAGPPFVQPVVTASGLERWARKSEAPGMREDVYMSLIEGPVRRAWLYHMYLTPNFELLTVPAYITAQSTSNLIRTVTARELRNSAETALLQYKPIISEHTIYLEAEEAFRALATYLKEQMEAKKAPTTLLDAAVFSYVYLLLELQGGVWADRRLADIVRKFPALKTHRDTIRKNHYRARPPGLWKELNAKAVGG